MFNIFNIFQYIFNILYIIYINIYIYIYIILYVLYMYSMYIYENKDDRTYKRSAI